MRKWVYVVFLIVLCCGCVNKKTAENENGLENNSTTSENINNPDSFPINGKVYVAPSDGLNLRSNYGITGEKIKLLPQNIALIVLERSEEKETIDGMHDYWYRVDAGEETGWVFGGYLSFNSNEFEIEDANGTWVYYEEHLKSDKLINDEYSWGMGRRIPNTSLGIDLEKKEVLIGGDGVYFIDTVSKTKKGTVSLKLFYISDEERKSPVNLDITFLDYRRVYIVYSPQKSNRTLTAEGKRVWYRLSGPPALYEKALVYLDDAIALQPDEPYNHLWRGDVLYNLGRMDEAIISLTRAIDMYGDDKSRDAYWIRSLVYRSLEKYEEAINDLDKYIILTPKSIMYNVLNGHNSRALCYQALAGTTNNSTTKAEYLKRAEEDFTIVEELKMQGY